MIDREKFIVLGGTGNHDLDYRIIRKINNLGNLNLNFLHLNMDKYPDGESDLRITEYEKIKGKHVLVFQSLRYSNSTNLLEQFEDLVWASKNQYGALSVTAILPFMAFRRQDRFDNMREINRNLKFIQTMKHYGVENLILCDIHSKTTLDNCRDVGITAYNVDPTQVVANYFKLRVDLAREEESEFYVYSPDLGSVGRTVSLAKALGVKIAVNFKDRAFDGNVSMKNDDTLLDELINQFGVDMIIADERLRNCSVCMREDELSTGGTAKMAGWYLKREVRVDKVFFYATHPVCVDGWKRKLMDDNPFDAIVLGDTIPRGYSKSTGGLVDTIDMSGVIAEQLFKVMVKLNKR